jgi:acyl-CoA dehydrogenase
LPSAGIRRTRSFSAARTRSRNTRCRRSTPGGKTFVADLGASGGSDPGRAIKTRAEKKGDRYILNGTKIWISGVGQSDWGLVFARTGPSKGRDGVTSFIVEKKFKGFSYKPIPVIRSYFPYEINFEDCEVPEENRLGARARASSSPRPG